MMEKPNDNGKCKPNAYSLIKYFISLRGNLDHKRSVRANYMYLLYKLSLFPNEQGSRIDDRERQYILALRNQGYSMGDLSFIFSRSKSSIFAVVDGNEEDAEIQE